MKGSGSSFPEMRPATITAGKKARWTDAEIMRWPKDGVKRELIEGDIYMSPVGYTHTNICINLSTRLNVHVRKHDLGSVCDSSMGFRLGPKTLLSPDVSFVSHTRLAETMTAPEKFLKGAPDLAVEVLSPSDLRSIVSLKLDKYLVAGARVAWLVDPKKGTVEVRTPDASRVLTKRSEVLDGGDVMPGFRCKLAEIFAA